MKSLYGDLPPTTHNEEGEIIKKTLNIFNNPTHYVELNKDVITPVVVQRNIKGQNLQNKENENKIKENNNTHKYNIMETTQYYNENNYEEIKEDEDLKKKETCKEQITKQVPTEILNINRFVQDDLKKISERLNKLSNTLKEDLEKESNLLVNNESQASINMTQHVYYNNKDINEMSSMNIIESTSYEDPYHAQNQIEKEINNCFYENNVSDPMQGSSFVKEDELGVTGLEAIPKNEFTFTQQSICNDPYANVNAMDEETFQMLMNTNETFQKYFILNENEDYDPMQPNSLNHIVQERKRKKMVMLSQHKKRLEEMQREAEQKMERQRIDSFERYIKEKDEEYQEETDENTESEYENEIYDRKNRSNDKEEHKKNKRNIEHKHDYFEAEEKEYQMKPSNEHKMNYYKMKETKPKKDFATRMMEKMGWKQGEGLGRDKQGIKAPLILQKVDNRTGVIVQAPDILKKEWTHKWDEDTFSEEKMTDTIYYEQKQAHKTYQPKSNEGNEIKNIYERIVCLFNIITPKEMHSELKKEVKEKMEKYGNVINIHIRVNKNAKKNDLSGVKIYCEYESKEQAMQAIPLLNDRKFYGRKIKAYTVDKEEYERYCKK